MTLKISFVLLVKFIKILRMNNQNMVVHHESVKLKFLVEFVLLHYLSLRNILSQCTHSLSGHVRVFIVKEVFVRML